MDERTMFTEYRSNYFAQRILTRLDGRRRVGNWLQRPPHPIRLAPEPRPIHLGPVDDAMSNVQFSDFSGYSVFIDDKYLISVDKGYLVGSLRHKVLENGGSLVRVPTQLTWFSSA